MLLVSAVAALSLSLSLSEGAVAALEPAASVSDGGILALSLGETWTSRTSAADNSWFSVTYGNGLFVAVSLSGVGNRVMTSGMLIPNAPAAPSAVAGDRSATVTVTQASSGGLAASHTITALPGGATCTVVGAVGSCVVSGLVNGTAYTFTATATNAGGTSPASAASPPIIPTAKPMPKPSNVITVTKAKAVVFAKAITLTTSIRVRGPGRIVQKATTKKGRKITTRCTATKTAARAGTYKLICRIAKSGRDALRRGALRLTLRTSFTPTRGTQATKTQTLTLARRR